ncbi:RNA ligase family protein [Candidatus Parabeggiatoa sp. HSG14]|uniref:ATP-dependent DNA ligase n=1 Tax=Candidatus Parabeggiatoa sp. HSG14 TaxID=3055593 RepID=UPI0025A867F9|nr:RNA ligase family protein [Thiotrichales bacterium HSG14]
MMTSENITLYFKQGSSDKIYKASIEEADSKHFVVNFAYGRRGATLKTGTKTQTSVDYAKAKKIYDKLVKDKTSKGYMPGEEGSQYVHTDTDMRETGVQCQLLNFVEESVALQLINDKNWWAQEKHDGKRMLIHKTDSITAINRKGLSIGAPDTILNSAGQVDQAYLVDGEAVGEQLFAFDLLEIDNTDIRTAPYSKRLLHLKKLGFNGSIIVTETAKTKKEKQQLYDRLKVSGMEGIVFKKSSAPYTAGRPNSGGNQIKFKFYATASVIVTSINQKRSVAVAVIADKKQVNVGNVTIPPNKEVPVVDSIIEVRYLYAYKGGNLYQPTYLGVRDDISFEDCLISQLKYKKETE